ncbi:MAG: LPP20 family lipoprotein [Campylobacterales bacterium]
MKLAFFGILAFALLFSGCSQKRDALSKEDRVEITEEVIEELPEWVVEPKVDNALAAVGMAPYSRHGLSIMLPEAELDGRARLAAKIESTLSRLQEQNLRHAKINAFDDIDNAFKSTTKEVVSEMKLSGAERKKMYQDADGTLYVLMAIEKKEVGNELESFSDSYKKQLQQAKLSRENIEEGMEILGESIDELEENID